MLINPQVPTAEQLAANPALSKLNSNNPYLRSSDPALVVQVLISKLNSEAIANKLLGQGYGTDYTVGPGSAFGSSLIVLITASGPSPERSLAETRAIGQELTVELKQMQTINGADAAYLFTAIPVDLPTAAAERVSSRLRSVIVVAVAGLVLMFGVVSVSEARDQASSRAGSRTGTIEVDTRGKGDRASQQASKGRYQLSSTDEASRVDRRTNLSAPPSSLSGRLGDNRPAVVVPPFDEPDEPTIGRPSSDDNAAWPERRPNLGLRRPRNPRT